MAVKKRAAKAPKAKARNNPSVSHSAPAAPTPPSAAGRGPSAGRATGSSITRRPALASPGKSTSSIPVHRVKRPLPAKSVQRAADAFKNFSLSRFARSSVPANYVPAAQAKTPAAVAAVQRAAVTKQVATLAANPPPTLGISVALTPASLAQFLPSLNAKTGTVGLAELLSALQQNLRGKQFYATGNPTLNLVAQGSMLLSQVQAYINALKAGSAGTTASAGATGTTTTHSGAPNNPGVRPRPSTAPGRAAHATAAKGARAIKKGGV